MTEEEAEMLGHEASMHIESRWSKEGEFAEALANGTTLEQQLAAARAEAAAMREETTTMTEVTQELQATAAIFSVMLGRPIDWDTAPDDLLQSADWLTCQAYARAEAEALKKLLTEKDALIHQLGENAAAAAREYAEDMERLRTSALEWKAHAKALEEALRKIDRMNDHPGWFRKSLNDIIIPLIGPTQ